MSSEQYQMLSFDLGIHSFPITTSCDSTQQLFDQGLNWCFAFNHEEGLACFKKALELDPDCAILHWGAAYAAGPFYNMPWADFSIPEAAECTAFCSHHLRLATTLSKTASTLEQALIAALSQRIQLPHPVSQKQFDQWDDAYADAMRMVNRDFPDNQDVMALLVEAMMTRTPWKMWDVNTATPPEGADTLEAIDVCEHAIALADAQGIDQHPAILHLHIHLLEMSNTPERALNSANRLVGLCPDAGHIHHMPGHIYVLCGDYNKAKAVSEKAVCVNRKYLEYAGPYNFYTTARCHDLHLLMYSCMFLGQYQSALAAADEICENLTPDVVDQKDRPYLAGTMEAYFSMRMHVLVRFGRWQDIVDTDMPENPSLYCVSTAMHHYAKGVAYAALKDFVRAEEQKELFYHSLASIPHNRKFFNNPALQTLGVGEKMLLGELAYHQGKHEAAYKHLRESVARCDQLHYSEPWPWMHPPRHALGALLSAQGHWPEAESVYRADLGLTDEVPRCAQHKNNVWALHGLLECLKQREEKQESVAVQESLEVALGYSDVSITSSCCCRNPSAN